MRRRYLQTAAVALLGLSLAVLSQGCSDGSDGAAGPAGPPGPPGPPGASAIDASTASPSQLAELDVVSEITSVSIASPPVITFTMATAEGLPIVGLVPFWEDNHRFIRFTITKLVPGEVLAGLDPAPDNWVAYVRDTSGAPTYDSGASLVDNEDGSYTFTFNTDIANVTGVTYEPTLTHRVAGQIGQYSTVPLEEQNVWLDFVPDGTAVTRTRNIAVMESCNECHTDLVFHGRRFEVEYCVQCHNPDLAAKEGTMSFMIHRIHSAGDFNVLDDAISYAEVTYPQDVTNCRKCHNVDDAATPQGDNWRVLPNIAACNGCHDVFGDMSGTGLGVTHTGGNRTDGTCQACHTVEQISSYHVTPNATPNNPDLLPGQRNITYELIDAAVDGTTNVVTINFRILSDGTALDVTNLPADLENSTGTAFRYPAFLLAWALPQDGVTDMVDYNNLGRAAAQPPSLGLNTFGPIATSNPIGTLAFNAADGVTTATITATASQYPTGAGLRSVGLQGYFQQDLNADGTSDVSLHTPAAVVAVTGDVVRREVVDSAKCAQCHEWFEGHGGNRVYEVAICTQCHVPNLTSSGRTLDVNHPEDTQNLKDMIHGIHASEVRTRDYVHVRNFNGNANFYNWSEVTFPSSEGTSSCTICHLEGTYELPLATGVLATAVRTTAVANGQDATTTDVTNARAGGALPNATDWVNTPTASSCFYCHTSTDALAHMTQNGAQLTVPDGGQVTNRTALGDTLESCSICHGAGRSADVEVVHSR